jgi:hypothetical protein
MKSRVCIKHEQFKSDMSVTLTALVEKVWQFENGDDGLDAFACEVEADSKAGLRSIPPGISNFPTSFWP